MTSLRRKEAGRTSWLEPEHSFRKDRPTKKTRSAGTKDHHWNEVIERLPLWQLDIVEVTGHNLEAKGREEVNRLLAAGWILIHVYTLKYEEDGVWRERPMGVLARLRNVLSHSPEHGNGVAEAASQMQ